MKKLFSSGVIIMMFLYEGFAESRNPGEPDHGTFAPDGIREKQREAQTLAEAYIKKYHGLPDALARNLNTLCKARDSNGKSDSDFQIYVNSIDKKYRYPAVNKGTGGQLTAKPSEYLKQDYVDNNEFQQSVDNANNYRKMLGPEMRSIVPALPDNYGNGPAQKVDMLSWLPARASDVEHLKEEAYGPAATRENMVGNINYAPDPVKPTPEQTASFNRSLKRSYYKQLTAKNPGYKDGKAHDYIMISDVVASAAVNKARAQQLLGRPIKTEADAEAAVKLLQANPLTIEGPGISKQDGSGSEMTQDQYMLKRPSSRKFYIKALPGVARNESNKKPRAGKGKTLFHV